MDLIEVYIYIVDTVVDFVVQWTFHPLPHVGLQLVTLRMLQDKCATPHSAHDQKTQGLIDELNHTQHNHNPTSNGHENGRNRAIIAFVMKIAS